MPGGIAFVFHAVAIVLDTVRHRVAAPTFTIIAACFGTAKLSTLDG